MARHRWWPGAVAGLALLLAGGLAWHFGPRFLYARYGYLALRATPDRMSDSQRAELVRRLHGLKAQVVFSSSRDGQHQIYLLTLPEVRLYRLTEHDRVDYFPRFSPDGRRLSLARSQRPWASEREMDPWDAWVIDLAEHRERLVARHANYPQWVDDARLSFLRGRQVVVKDLRSGEERVVYDADRSPVRGLISNPELRPGDERHLALTARGRLSGVFVVDLLGGEHRQMGDGCELTWFPDGGRVLWVANGGRGGTHLLASPWERPAPREFMDLPGEHGHEYFGRLSRDGRYLVWGAAAEGHEHDVADYDIFLWDTHAPRDQAVRLTFNPANERWPDIHLLPGP